MSRCAGLARAAEGRYQVLALQFGRSSSVYPWHSPELASGLRLESVSDGIAEDVGILAVFRAVQRLLREHNIAAVFVPGYWPPASLAVLAAALVARRPAIMMTASHDGAASRSGLRREIKRLLVRLFDAALVGGSRHRAHFIAMGLDPERVFPGYDVVDNDYYTAATAAVRADADRIRQSLGLPERYFLNLGRLVSKKNLCTLLRAFARLRQRHPDCPQLVLVGDGPERDRLIHLARELQLTISAPAQPCVDADVHIHPFTQVDRTPAFYALAEAFILPSTIEEWGLVVNEAMACGLPVVVSSAAGCCQDLVRHGENGFVFDPTSVDELALHMERFVIDPSLRSAMAAKSSALIGTWGLAHFALNAIAAAEAASPNKSTSLLVGTPASLS